MGASKVGRPHCRGLGPHADTTALPHPCAGGDGVHHHPLQLHVQQQLRGGHEPPAHPHHHHPGDPGVSLQLEGWGARTQARGVVRRPGGRGQEAVRGPGGRRGGGPCQVSFWEGEASPGYRGCQSRARPWADLGSQGSWALCPTPLSCHSWRWAGGGEGGQGWGLGGPEAHGSGCAPGQRAGAGPPVLRGPHLCLSWPRPQSRRGPLP